MTVKLDFGIFESVLVDFGLIFEVKLHIDSRVAYIFDFNILFIDIVEGYVEVEL